LRNGGSRKARGVVDAVSRLEDLPNARLLTRNLAL
jgi:hypothetical protein